MARRPSCWLGYYGDFGKEGYYGVFEREGYYGVLREGGEKVTV